jgi:hypothetical protein
MWKTLVMSLARGLVVTALNTAVQRALSSIDKTNKLGPADKEVARGAILELVQELGKELGTTL